MVQAKSGGRLGVGQVYATHASIGTRPFLEATFARAQAGVFATLLRQAAAAPERHRVTIIASADLPTRFRVTTIASPEYERSAATLYLRGENLVVQGIERKSVNLDLSQDGATALADRLDRAAGQASYVNVRVPSRKRNLLEIEPNDDAAGSAEDTDTLAHVAATLIGSTLPADAFADWPGAVAPVTGGS